MTRPAWLNGRFRNGGEHVDTAELSSERIELPPPLVHAPRIPRDHRPMRQIPLPIEVHRVPVWRRVVNRIRLAKWNADLIRIKYGILRRGGLGPIAAAWSAYHSTVA